MNCRLCNNKPVHKDLENLVLCEICFGEGIFRQILNFKNKPFIYFRTINNKSGYIGFIPPILLAKFTKNIGIDFFQKYVSVYSDFLETLTIKIMCCFCKTKAKHHFLDTHFHCLKCQKSYCTFCLDDHPEINCPNKRQIFNTIKQLETEIKLKIKRCPICKFLITESQNCIDGSCDNCNTELFFDYCEPKYFSLDGHVYCNRYI